MKGSLNRNGLSRLTVCLLIVAAVFSVVHHTDHVLRVDHSGWPFKNNVTPFTFSLLAYPMILIALWGPRGKFWLRWGILAIGTGFTLVAHTMVESPQMQYAMWADDYSLEASQEGIRNLLDIHSRSMGVAAVAISMTLNLLALASTVSMLVDGRRRRERPAES